MSETSYTPVEYQERVQQVTSSEIPPTSSISADPAYPRCDKVCIIAWAFENAEALYVDNEIRHQSSSMDVIADKDREYEFKALTPENRFITQFPVKTVKRYFNFKWPGHTQFLYAASFENVRKVLTGDGTILNTYQAEQDWVIDPSTLIIDDTFVYIVVSSASSFKIVKLKLDDMSVTVESDVFTFTPQSYNIRFGIYNDGTTIKVIFHEGNVLTLKELLTISLETSVPDVAIDTPVPNEYERVCFIGNDGTDDWVAFFDGTDTKVYHGGVTIPLSNERICGNGPDGYFFTDRKVYHWNTLLHTASADIWDIEIYKENFMLVSVSDDSTSPDMCRIYRFEISSPSNIFHIADSPINGAGSDERFYGTMESSGTAVMSGLYSSTGRMYLVRYDGDTHSTEGITL